MAAYTPESESQEILSQQQKDLITQSSSSSSSSTIDEQQQQQYEHEQQDLINEEEDDEVIVGSRNPETGNPRRGPHKCLEGYVEPSDDDDLPRTKSLTDDDLDELKGCVDLGFGFSYDEIPELCNTLPALELCYSMSQKFLDDHPNQQQQQQFHNQSSIAKKGSGAASDTASSSGSESSSPIPTWKISSPGDHPEDVKARLKFWAQAVACTVKLCS